ncbi:MAG: hypothetical protein ACLRZ6_10815 [Lachnospiraceae bacterium]
MRKAADQLEEMIRLSTVLSIICWACNSFLPMLVRIRQLIRKMVERSHELDPSRQQRGQCARDGFDVLEIWQATMGM